MASISMETYYCCLFVWHFVVKLFVSAKFQLVLSGFDMFSGSNLLLNVLILVNEC